MPYSYKEIPESERESNLYEVPEEDLGALHVEDLELEKARKTPYEILDEQGDQIAVVYSEVDAEALVSHLNR